MKISVIGAGYVGLVTSAVFAEWGHDVICLDNDRHKIDRIQAGQLPVHEPGLAELVTRSRTAGRLHYTADAAEALADRDLLMIAVGTPSDDNGQPNLQAVWAVIKTIKQFVTKPVTVAIKSTIPVGTSEAVWKFLNQKSDISEASADEQYDIVFVPEFLRQGTAITDFLAPDRNIVGCRTEQAKLIMRELLGHLEAPLLFADWESAEMIKYAANAYLAMKISYINSIANLCEEVGADINEVIRGLGLDRRIGPAFLKPGVGFGGSCLPKDTQALVAMGLKHEVNVSLFQDILVINQQQRMRLVNKLTQVLGSLQGKRIAVLGLAFKANTNDVREAPALDIISRIVELGGQVVAYDPVVDMEQLSKLHSFSPASSTYAAVSGAHAVVILTDWDEFYEIDLQRVHKLVKHPLIIDGRNLFERQIVRQYGFEYHSVGVPAERAPEPVK